MTPRDLAAAGFTEEPAPDMVLLLVERMPPVAALTELGKRRIRIVCPVSGMVTSFSAHESAIVSPSPSVNTFGVTGNSHS